MAFSKCGIKYRIETSHAVVNTRMTISPSRKDSTRELSAIADPTMSAQRVESAAVFRCGTQSWLTASDPRTEPASQGSRPGPPKSS